MNAVLWKGCKTYQLRLLAFGSKMKQLLFLSLIPGKLHIAPVRAIKAEYIRRSLVGVSVNLLAISEIVADY